MSHTADLLYRQYAPRGPVNGLTDYLESTFIPFIRYFLHELLI